MMAFDMLGPAAAALLIAAALTPLFAGWARRRNLLDVPNQRSSHVVATPRTGGPAFVLALLAGIVIASFTGVQLTTEGSLIVAAACALALLGLIDDVRSLPAITRLLAQGGVALLLVLVLPDAAAALLEPSWIAMAMTVIWLVALTNAYNFMDGIDGIAAGQAVVAGLGWAAVGAIIDSPDTVLLGLLLASAPAGFLIHNWPPARVFMGDAGSGFLGFFFAALPLLVTGRGSRGMIWAALMTWPFLFDTGFTLLRRVRRGENVLRAHRSHLYQRLIVSGLTHGRVALLYSVLASLGTMGAIAHAAGQPGALALSAAAVVSAAFGLWRYVVACESRAGRVSEPSERARRPAWPGRRE
jgi:Fuc2NAc and GlcNAc transferase